MQYAKISAPLSSVVVSLFSASGITALHATSNTSPTCKNVYLVDSGNRFINPPNTYAEVSFAVDDSEFTAVGKLGSFDWGAFLACGRELKLRFRGLAETTNVSGPVIHRFKKDYSIQLHSENMYFGLRGWGYKEISSDEGEKAIAAINARPSRAKTPPTGWEWVDRRELYYGKGSKCAMEKSDRCP